MNLWNSSHIKEGINLAVRPKYQTINKKIYTEIQRLLETTHFRDITIDQISENTGISKATIYRRWKDKSSIIMSAFIEQSQYIVIHNQDNLYDDLFQFLVKIKDIYKTKLGSAVIEILISHQQMEARETFMTNYFNHNRKVLKEIVRKHIQEEEQDLFIDLIFSPIYFNILIKPETLDKNYIKKMLNQVLRIYH